MFQRYYTWKARSLLKKIDIAEAERIDVNRQIRNLRGSVPESYSAKTTEEVFLRGRFYDILEDLQSLREKYNVYQSKLINSSTAKIN